MGAVFDEIAGEIDHTRGRPIWMMRQAGRYLPEYRAVRAKFPSFLDFCYHPEAATEVTLQPIDRFGFDAAIIFSDILVIPQALGQDVWFVTGEGPKLGPLPSIQSMRTRLESGDFLDHLNKVYSAITMTREALNPSVDLFGFAGAPWTLATYMLEGGSSKTYSQALAFADSHADSFKALMALVEEAVVLHLNQQIKAGANIVQVFDSWAGGIPSFEQQKAWSFDPLSRIARGIGDDVPMVLFAKGQSLTFANHANALFDQGTVACAVGQEQSLRDVRRTLGAGAITQGNVDPLLVNGEWSTLSQATRQLLDDLDSQERHVVNLGHGITPQGDPDNVARWVGLVQESER